MENNKKINTSFPVKASICVAGLGQILQKQWIKGCLYLSCFVSYVVYLIFVGFKDIKGFFTLGTVKSDAWLGIKGDDSIMMLLRGLLAFAITSLFIIVHKSNVNDIKRSAIKLENGEALPKFRKACSVFVDKKFYIIALALPVIGVVIFNILPIVFMILISFTNYGGDIVPPELVDWIGFDNFGKILTLSKIKTTFL